VEWRVVPVSSTSEGQPEAEGAEQRVQSGSGQPLDGRDSPPLVPEELLRGFERTHPKTDLIALLGPIYAPSDTTLIDLLEERRRPDRESRDVVVLMITPGGSPHVAFRMARAIQSFYGLIDEQGSRMGSGRRFSLFAPSLCASAGTMFATGASELLVTPFSQFGPIDVQVLDPERRDAPDSSLVHQAALDQLLRASRTANAAHVHDLRRNKDVGLPRKAILEAASALTTGLMTPLYAQLNPIKIGEYARYTGITTSYAEKLDIGNLREDTIVRLVVEYPSHDTVIDVVEARQLFVAVKEPSAELRAIFDHMRRTCQPDELERVSRVRFMLG
jgi:hypothetical protein